MGAITIDIDRELLKSVVKEALTEVLASVSLPTSTEEYYTPKEACKMLSCAPSTLWKWEHNKGLITAYRKGGKVYYKKSDIDKMFQKVN